MSFVSGQDAGARGRSRRILLVAAGVVALCAALSVGARLAVGPLERLAERRVRTALQQAYGNQLQVKNIHVDVFSGALELTGIKLQRGDPGAPPLFSIARASSFTRYWDFLRKPIHIKSVRLEQLEIHVPPRGEGGAGPHGLKADGLKADGSKADEPKASPSFVVDELLADGATLEILPKKSDKLPLEFALRELTVDDAGLGQPMRFRTVMTNAKPPGDIHSSGTVGPWRADEPALTPVRGDYVFKNADLSVFKGIAGTLSSEGSYQGVLDQVSVQGRTDTPDFAVKVSGNRVHLVTQFQAVVDGMNGDTRLDRVNGQFGHTSLIARGVVRGNRGEHGKTVDLDVEIDQGRLEDVLSLGVKGKPPMSGAITFRTKLVIPPGAGEIRDKLILNGQFDARQASFKENIQQRIDKLSERGRGEPRIVDAPDVASNLLGRFALQGGVMTFQQLTFQVPGAQLALNGTYNLMDERIEMRGTARLTVKLSQTVTGFKSVLLKALDPLFSRNGAGTQLPILIEGTRSHPSFRLRLKDSLR